MFKKLIVAAFLLLSLKNSFGSSVNSGYVAKSNNPHSVIPLHDGRFALIKRIDLIRNAKKSIELEYFIFNDDLAGKIIVDELIKAAKKGVKVRLLLDSLMVKGKLTPFHIHQIKKQGLEIRYYNDIPLIRAINTQYRDHRKLFIVDDIHLIIGGRNIANEYFDLDERYNFLDRDIYLTGEVVPKITKMFDDFWHSAPSSIVNRPLRPHLGMLEYLSSSSSARSRVLKKHRSDLRAWKQKVKRQKKISKKTPFSKRNIR